MSEATPDDMPPCYNEVMTHCGKAFNDLIECSTNNTHSTAEACRKFENRLYSCFAQTLCPKEYTVAAESDSHELEQALHNCWISKWHDCLRTIKK
jgi:hypothetical protein